MAFQYIKLVYKNDGDSQLSRHRTRNNAFKLKEGKFRLDTGKKIVQ